ncbi:MAG TPA: SGNH/GDSL hydrolase family protein [Mycobacteriales bacterium]|nr:SGNH/GDSL hydrolase family protein [Mycobacteriales bacterium]
MVRVRRFVALGDSFTEGLSDLHPDGRPRGWADLVADVLATGADDFSYANLAVRSLRIDAIVERQLPVAVALQPDLASIAGGANDLLGLRVDVDHVVARLDEAVRTLRATGADVVVFAGFDARAQLPTGRLLTSRTIAYNAGIRASAAAHGAMLIDLWSMRELWDPRLWSEDRLHLSTLGHRHIARVVLDTLGHQVPRHWSLPAGPPPHRSWLAARASEIAWSRSHLAPWAVRKIRGRSMGDGRAPKYPELVRWQPER